MNELRVRLVDHRDKIKVSWTYLQPGGARIRVTPRTLLEDCHYEIEPRTLRAAARVARRDLRHLVKAWMEDGSAERIQARLARLVVSGVAMRDALFNTPRPDRHAELAKAWFTDQVERGALSVRICIEVSTKVSVPWGLLCSPGVRHASVAKGLQLNVEQSSELFWPNRFRMAVVQGIYDQIPGPLDQSSTIGKLVAVMNRPTMKSLKGKREWKRRPAFYDAVDFWSHIQENQPQALYLYCHSNSSSLDLGAKDSPADSKGLNALDADEFHRWWPRHPDGRVLFLNGCSNALESHVGEAWREVARDTARQGFIATETEVPSGFAWEFGLELIEDLVTTGHPLLVAFERQRRRHWPLSAVYTAYAPPWVRFLRRARVMRAATKNLSVSIRERKRASGFMR